MLPVPHANALRTITEDVEEERCTSKCYWS